jgi:hypothetical protein
MKKHLFRKIYLLVIGIVLTISMTGCGIQDTEDTLAASGFKMKLANTPEKLAHLKTLSQHNLVSHERNGEVYFVYADADNCKCMYVGDEKAYQQYQKLVIKQNLAEEKLEAAEDIYDRPTRWGFRDAWGPEW